MDKWQKNIVEQNDTENSWSWLRNTGIKGETEGLLKINASIHATAEKRSLVRISTVCAVCVIKEMKLCHL